MFKFLLLTLLIYIVGLSIYFDQGHLIYILISIEIMLLAIGLSFFLTSYIIDDIIGSLITMIILPIAGAESAIGLSFLINYMN